MSERTARVRDDVDVPVDRKVVEQFAAAVEAGSIESITALLAEDVWGVVDGGGLVKAPTKPTFGPTAVSRHRAATCVSRGWQMFVHDDNRRVERWQAHATRANGCPQGHALRGRGRHRERLGLCAVARTSS